MAIDRARYSASIVPSAIPSWKVVCFIDLLVASTARPCFKLLMFPSGYPLHSKVQVESRTFMSGVSDTTIQAFSVFKVEISALLANILLYLDHSWLYSILGCLRNLSWLPKLEGSTILLHGCEDKYRSLSVLKALISVERGS